MPISALELKTMSNRITEAFREHQAATTAAAIRKTVRTYKARGYPQSADDIRWSEAMTLRDAVDAELVR
jgi:hypothetical protein